MEPLCNQTCFILINTPIRILLDPENQLAIYSLPIRRLETKYYLLVRYHIQYSLQDAILGPWVFIARYRRTGNRTHSSGTCGVWESVLVVHGASVWRRRSLCSGGEKHRRRWQYTKQISASLTSKRLPIRSRICTKTTVMLVYLITLGYGGCCSFDDDGEILASATWKSNGRKQWLSISEPRGGMTLSESGIWRR